VFAAAWLSACGDDFTESGSADATLDTGTASDTPDAEVADVADAAPLADTKPDVAAATADTDTAKPDAPKPDLGPQPVGLWTQIAFPGDPNTSLHGVWSDGPTRTIAAGSGGTIAGDSGAGWKVLETGHFASLNAVAGAPGGTLQFAVGIAGTVVMSKGEGGKPGLLWTPPGACKKPAECDDADPCTIDVCESGQCTHAQSAAAGCCGGTAFADSFDKGLGNWTVVDTFAAGGNGGIVWSAAAMQGKDGSPRWTSPPNAAYFGRTDVPCANNPKALCPTFDNGKVVGATMTSGVIQVPKATQVTLSFQALVDLDPNSDTLTLQVQPQPGVTETVWQKSKAFPSGSSGGQFKLQLIDLSKFAGQKIKLAFTFNSQTAFNNAGEGVFLDDLLLTSKCAQGQTSGKGLTKATLFGAWAASDSDAWAVGAEGAIAHWDGATWSMNSGSTQTQDLFGLGGADGGPAFAVGAGGALASVGAGGLGSIPSGVTVALRGVAVRKAGDGWEAVAVGDGALLEWSGAAWLKAVSPGATFQGKGVAALGDGSFVAVGSNQVWERLPGLPWQLKAAAPGSLQAVAPYGTKGDAVAVGTFGMVGWRKAGVWSFQTQAAGLGGLYAVATDEASGEVFAAADGGIVQRFTGIGGWVPENTATTINLRGLWVAPNGEVFACGALGTIVHRAGTTWTNMKSPKSQDWLAIWGRSATEVYVVGKGGVLQRWNGKDWTVVGAPVTATLRAVWGSKPDDVWAVGEGAAIYHFAGSGWQPVPIEPYDTGDPEKPYVVKSTLLAVWGGKPNDVWAAGEPDQQGKGVLVHWDGAKWEYVPVMQGEGRTFRAIWGWSEKAVLFAGSQGMVYRYANDAFQPLNAPTIATIFAITGTGKHALLAGDIGTLLQFTPLDQVQP
jgi:hypothetical protein